MGEALFELGQHLRYKQVKLTPEEIKLLFTCKSKAVREFTFGGLAAATVAWTASKKLNKFVRLNLSGGAAAIFGLWIFSRSLNSCVDHILSQDGSRLQAELATIMVKKYQNDPSMMRLISKQFYSEKVFDDANSDQPTLRWRYRNYFSDNITHGRRTDYSNPQGDSEQASHGDHQSASDSDSRNIQNDSDKKRFAPKQVPMNSNVDSMVDPFDCVFGNTSGEEILLPSWTAFSRRRASFIFLLILSQSLYFFCTTTATAAAAAVTATETAQTMKVHPMPRKRNITVQYSSRNSLSEAQALLGPNHKKLRRLPHVFSRVLELPFRSDADVLVQENPDCFRFVAEADNIGDDVRAHTVEIHPGVTKIVVRESGSVELTLDELELDMWRFRLPESTRPELASAVFVDGELIVTVPKAKGVGNSDGGDGGGEVWGGGDGNGGGGFRGGMGNRLVLVQ
ncbi:hypothetical protein D8674_017084 [Pyrus ussuriensis x Pyrus communis]|uniref:SHSP domain-containing protein n=1 Tax=Pyrus ussuriensis x Pyrus communis TaxID=2448454 RepID=A0A5N5HQ41_9ROSA|nr:hypothetical protein D8674_017084 [Pyrus ussuriensis x Pyrus communis]